MNADLIWQAAAVAVILLVGLVYGWLEFFLTPLGLLAVCGLYAAVAIVCASLQGVSEGLLGAYRQRRSLR